MIQNYSNWGRWGPDDEKGMLNEINSPHILNVIKRIKTGTVYSLGAPVGRLGPIGARNATQHIMSSIQIDEEKRGYGSSDDVLVTHTHASTHLDALCHHWQDSKIYNGYPWNTVTPDGAKKCGVQNVEWIITRGILLDIPSAKGTDELDEDYAITTRDLDEAVEFQGVTIHDLDFVFVRTGWYRKYLREPNISHVNSSGLSEESKNWLTRYNLIGVGADNVAVEIWPPEQTVEDDTYILRHGVLPIHVLMLNQLGAYLLELLNLEEISKNKIYEFTLVIAPLKITGGIGSPVNPLAIV